MWILIVSYCLFDQRQPVCELLLAAVFLNSFEPCCMPQTTKNLRTEEYLNRCHLHNLNLLTKPTPGLMNPYRPNMTTYRQKWKQTKAGYLCQLGNIVCPSHISLCTLSLRVFHSPSSLSLATTLRLPG